MAKKLPNNAKVEITINNEIKEYFYPRNLIAIKEGLEKDIPEGTKDAITEIKVFFRTKEEDAWAEVTKASSWATFQKWLDNFILDFNAATTRLLQTCFHLTEVSNLKCGMVTLGFEDAQITGMGIHSDTIPVTPEEVKGMLAGAQGQLDMFTDKMSKVYSELEVDNKLVKLRSKLVDTIIKNEFSVIDGSRFKPDIDTILAEIKPIIVEYIEQ